MIQTESTSVVATPTSTLIANPTTVTKEKVRLRFRKERSLRFISHHDLMRCWDRLLRRAGIAVKFSQGFHAKAVLSSPLSLALGLVGLEEILEIELAAPMTMDEITSRLADHLPDGLALVSLTRHPLAERTEVVAVQYAVVLPPLSDWETPRQRAAAIQGAATLPVVRRTPGKPDRVIDLKPWLLDLTVAPPVARWRVRVDKGATARPEELLGLLGLEEALQQGATMTRTRVELAKP